jgi:uncharacterized membrane protein
VSSSEIALIFRWVLPLWALGWLILPLSSRLFSALPDKGLAAGRVVALVFVGVLTFWGAALHLVPLQLAPLTLIAISLAVGIGWKNPIFRISLRPHWRAFAFSDAVFLLAFAAFLWVRLRHPETNDLEKPMDMAILSSAMRAEWLPFQNPWFAGQEFTNYYYFGPFLGALLGRTLATPPYLAYNLIQPVFCAFFLSTLWSLASALSKSLKIGVLAMLLVGVGGHFEPLRQWAQSGQFWPLDWWKTSRVIENTINEYPAFTMLTGDLHAHFFALCLATTHFCICFCLVQAESPRLRSLLMLTGGIFLGVFALTNTWDTPFYGFLWLGCALWKRKTGVWSRSNDFALFASFFVAPLVALPYFLRFKSQVSGVVFNPWLPDLFSLALLWGGWWMLGFWALTLSSGEEKPSNETIFRRFLMGIGALALVFPFVFYIRGVFGDGDLRHQDTVFKFGLQAWLLLGTGVACEAGCRIKNWWHSANWPFRVATTAIGAAFFAVIGLAPACVAWTRTTRDAPRDEVGNTIYSLNAARFLPAEELQGIEWLRRNARANERIVEPVSFINGQVGGDYDPNFGRISAFSGVPSVLGWPQHVAGWGAPYPEIQRRAALVNAIYNGSNPVTALEELGATYIFWSNNPPPGWNEHNGIARVWNLPGQENGAQIWRYKP